MTRKELLDAVQEKLHAQFIRWVTWLKTQPADTILSNADKYLVYADIDYALGEIMFDEGIAQELTPEQCEALLADEDPLQNIYDVYSCWDDPIIARMEDIREAIKVEANKYRRERSSNW